jgi:hypothetical protein
MPNFMYQRNTMEIITYHRYCLLLPFYLYVHINFCFQVHRSHVKSDISLVTFCFWTCNYFVN